MYSKVMNIVYFTSNFFVSQAGVSIISLLENNREEEIKIFILCSQVTAENKNKLQSIAMKYNRSIEMIDSMLYEDILRNEYKLPDKSGYIIYNRLLIDRIFPHLEKILCIDSDTIISGRLRDLYDINLDNKLFAVVPNLEMTRNIVRRKSKRNCFIADRIEKSVNGFSINTGVLLVNLKRWRTIKFEHKIKDTIELLKEEEGFYEQEIFEIATDNKEMLKVALKYNYWGHMLPERMARYMLVSNQVNVSINEFYEAENSPIIIHYVGVKPDNIGCPSRRMEDFLKYRKLSPWAEDPFERKKNTSVKLKLLDSMQQSDCVLLYRMMNGLIQITVRPRRIISKWLKNNDR